MALWSGGVYVAAILFLTLTSYPVKASPGHVVCYYSSWAHYRQGLAKYTIEDIPVDLCTHLIYAFATLDNKTFLAKPFDTWLDIDLKNYDKFVQLKKKNPKMKVLLGLGGWNDSRSTKYSRLVADSNKRRTFVEEVVKLLLQYSFDGLDLDWEYPGYESKREDKQGFTQWVEDLKTALAPHKLLLTSAVSASRRVIDRGYDIPKIAKHLDLINLMTYDFHGSWERVVAHHSPLYPEVGQNPEFCADFAVNYWIKKGAPAHKIVLGVPLYGRSWTLAGEENYPGSAALGAGKRSKYVKERGHMAYFECCLAHQKEGWAKVTGDGGPYLTKDNQWVGYDDIDAVIKKAEYARNKGLGGVMVWDTVSDDFNNACGQGPNPLLTAIANTLAGKKLPSTHSSSKPLVDLTTAQPEIITTTISTTTVQSWQSENTWNLQLGNEDSVQTRVNTIEGTTSIKGWPRSNNDNSQTTKLPYKWLAWPVFSKSPDGTQNSITSSLSETSSSTVTKSPFSVNRPETSTKSPFAVSRPEFTTKSPFSIYLQQSTTKSPFAVSFQQSTTKSPFSISLQQATTKSPFLISFQQSTTMSPFSVSFQQSTTKSPFSVFLQQSTTKPPFFVTRPPSPTSLISSASALTWFSECKSLGFAPDPSSCSAFYRCTKEYAYRFTCPGGLLWHQDESSCDWPNAVQCVLPLIKPDLEPFRPPETSLF